MGYGDTFPTSTLGKWIAAVAMLMGVLVIALPVSVFSDLWSKELRKTGVLTALDDDDEKKLESNVDSAQSRSSLYNSLEELPPSSRWTNNERQEIQIGLVRDSTRDMSDDLLAFNSDQIVVSKDDLTDLLAHVQTMNESQQQIRAILRKYKLA